MDKNGLTDEPTNWGHGVVVKQVRMKDLGVVKFDRKNMVVTSTQNL